MGQLLSKNLYYKSGYTQPDPKKTMATLSTGAIAYMEGDPNGTRDDGVSGSGTQQLSLYVLSADRSTVSAAVSFAYSDVSGTSSPWLPRYSMCVDSANNIHCVYVYTSTSGNQQSLRYRKATYSAGTFTWGAEQVIAAYVANRLYNAVDIDMPGLSVDFPMVTAVLRNGTSGSYTATMTVFNRNSASWPSQNIFAGVAYSYNTPDVSIACKQDAVSGSDVPTYVVTFNPGPLFSGQADLGDSVYAHRAAIGGAFTGSVVTVNSGLAKTLNAGYRNYWTFYLQNDFYLVYGEQQSSPNQYWWTVFSVSPASGAVVTAIAPRTGTHATYKAIQPAYALGAASLYRLGGGAYALAAYTIGAAQPIRSDLYLTYNGTVWSYRDPGSSSLPASGMANSATIKMVYANDASRFANALSPLVIAHYVSQGTTYTYKSWLYTRSHMQTVSAILSPTESQVVGTNQITGRVNVVYAAQSNDQTSPTYSARVQVQLATNSAFTTGLYTATQDVSLENPYSSTAVAVNMDLSAYPLQQMTWYMRARMIDSLGVVSPWSATRTFRVSHAPTPGNAQPADQGVIAYVGGASVFTWSFVDPYSADVQTAYQLTIKKTSDGSTAYDSGKVTSSSKSVSLDLGSGNLESYYDWYLTLWDAENVSGPVTYIGNFLFTGVPAPTWNTPASDGAVFNTALPVISWNSGVGAVKTQSAYRVVIRQGANLVFDSNIVQSAATTYQVPTGYLHNTQAYQVDVQVFDSVGLGATITRSFTTSWTSPAQPPAPIVNTARHHTFGYNAVRIDQSNIDATPLYYNLYRRTLDRIGSNWTLLASIYDLSGVAVYLDYLCPGGVMSEYMVTQVADRFGDTVESTMTGAPVTQYQSVGSSFWLIDANEPRRSMMIPNATAHTYTEEYEKTDYVIINGGRQVEEGERIGISGSVSSQIRPKGNGMGGQDVFNLAPNSNLLLTASAVLDGGYSTIDNGAQTAALAIGEVTSLPGPGNRGVKKLGTTVSKSVASSNQISAGFQRTITPSPYVLTTAGLKYNISGWFNIPTPVAGYEIRLRISWYYQGAVQAVDYAPLTSDLTAVGTQAVESMIIGSDTWYRINKVGTVPASCDEVRISVLVVSSGATVLSALTFYTEGLQMTMGTALLPYLSGYDYQNGVWTGLENVDPVYSPGYMSPRWVKQCVEYLRRSGHDLYIRTPFGDIWKVYVNDLSISNVAGTGPSEFVDMDIPYLQVR